MTENDQTILMPAHAPRDAGIPPIEVVFVSSDGIRREQRFSGRFVVGRGGDCGIRITDDGVSRHHLEVYPENGGWWARDMQSSNGSLVAGRPITNLQLQGTTTIDLGHNGPRIRLIAPSSASPIRNNVVADPSSRHNRTAATSEPADGQTTMVREALRDAKRKHTVRYLFLLAFAIVLAAVVGSFAYLQHTKLEKTTELAKEIFYDMKELELQILGFEASLDDATAALLKDQITASKRKLANMRERYEAFVETIQVARPIALNSQEQIILHIARVFGETEIDVPDDFVAEVGKYISKWQSSSRLVNAIKRLQDNNYSPTIVRALTSNGLPPQFIYLALQETNFRARAVGPPTRYGRAKGMWQFIPATGKRYGLRPGPLQATGKYDPQDDRHNVALATEAAAKYLSDIYRTDAQASGLLVMASYNWGEGNIIKRIRKMPKNPKERNFWQLLRRYKIPDETYHYVFYIFSAAVICENPKLFGFDFENPLRIGSTKF